MKIDKSLFTPEAQTLINLLESQEWPEAAPSFLICDENETDKIDRAEGILDYMNQQFAGKKFCDFGCGEGHVAKVVGKTASLSVGYDIATTGSLPWETATDGFMLTKDLEKVKQSAPYDFILLYDVIDHAQDPVKVLQTVKEFCNPDTKVLLRCHSWMSRHATHLYRKINKAWMHLVFTEEELKLMGLDITFTQKYFFPIKQQEEWLEKSLFKKISSDVVKCDVEPFFRRREIIARLPMQHFKDFPQWQMSQSFNDYVLQPS